MPKVAGPEPAKDQQSKDWALSTGVEVPSKKTTTAGATDWNRPTPDVQISGMKAVTSPLLLKTARFTYPHVLRVKTTSANHAERALLRKEHG